MGWYGTKAGCTSRQRVWVRPFMMTWMVGYCKTKRHASPSMSFTLARCELYPHSTGIASTDHATPPPVQRHATGSAYSTPDYHGGHVSPSLETSTPPSSPSPLGRETWTLGPWNGIIHRVVFLVELAPKRDPFPVEQVSASAAAGISQADARLVSVIPRSALS